MKKNSLFFNRLRRFFTIKNADSVTIMGTLSIVVALISASVLFIVILVKCDKSLLPAVIPLYLLMLAGGFILSTIFLQTVIRKYEFVEVLKNLDEGMLYGVFDNLDNKPYSIDLLSSLIPVTRKLVEEKYFTSMLDRQIEIQHLQNQINPHFIYNTLEGIRAKALLEDQEEIASMTEALGSFLRYNIGKLDEMVSLGQEMRNLERYAQIQEYRFGGRIKMSFEIDNPDLLRNLLIPKLTLQPIVENSVFHGLEPKAGPGLIRVTAVVTDSNVRICVSDDGIGMTEETLDVLNNRMLHKEKSAQPFADHSKSGIALENVNERIRLFFGDSYGVTIYSTYGAGTDVYVKLPLPNEMSEE